MNEDLWTRSRTIVSMLRSEIERRSRETASDPAAVTEAVLQEMTPPGWRYQLYPSGDGSTPDFMLLPAAFA